MKVPIGLRINTEVVRPEKALVEKFRGIPSSNIGDMMNRMYCMHEYIRSMNKLPMVGTAITVKAPIGDNLMFHYALDMAQPGDILVVDGGSAVNRSLAGEIMFTYAQQKGLAGIVVDGCIRDIEGIQELSIPVFAKGVTPQGPYKNGPGEINVPIACGGQVVCPGDLLVGDHDGVVVIPQADAPMVIDAALDKFNAEEEILDNYRKGNLDVSDHPGFYRNLLKQMGVHFN